MANNIDEDSQSLLLKMALQYTGGDETKAKAMVAGEYFDNIALKCKYLLRDSNHSGLLIAFFNTVDGGHISFFNTADTANSITFAQTDMGDSWSKFVDEITTLLTGSFGTELPGGKDMFISEMSSADFITAVKNRDELSIREKIVDILKKLAGEQQISCEIELEPATSLEMMQDGILASNAPEVKQEPFSSAGQNSFDLRQFAATSDKSSDYTVDGSVVLSPVTGKYIQDVQAGDRILLTLDPGNPLALNILRSMKAINPAGKAVPIVGIVIAKIPMPGNEGTLLHAIISKGIIVRLFEADNLKVAMADGIGNSSSNKVNEYIMYMLGGIALLVIVILLLLIFR